MDSLLAGDASDETVLLPYDTVCSSEGVSEAQATASSGDAQDVQPAALLNRIGRAKVYLLTDSAQTKTAKPDAAGKRKYSDIEEDEDVEMDEDNVLRANALFLTGTPISHLPTARIFAYVTHFNASPIGLEWVNDSSCVLVFESKTLARAAHRFLRKSLTEDMDQDGFVMAKSIPITLWLPEDRISKSLGHGEGLGGAIKMRWAKNDDMKKRGAKRESEFYRKYGTGAGKDGDAPLKRRRDDRLPLDASQLDEELDAFLGNKTHSSASTEIQADQLTENRSLIERTSPPESGVGLRRRVDANGHSGTRWSKGRGRRNPRPQKTQQELDDELDAFLKEKD